MVTEKSIVDGIGLNRYVERWQLRNLDSTKMHPDEAPLARAILFGETCSREMIVRRIDNEEYLQN